MDVINLIQNLGFPIACVFACGWFALTLWKEQMKDKDKLYVELAESRKVNEKAIETIAIYAEKLDLIQSDVKVIKEKVGA